MSPSAAPRSPRIPDLQVVWFKRDLRVYDHVPLAEAARRGPVLPLYIAEPSVVRADDFSAAHWQFIRESLQELRRRLAERGQPLVVRRGEAVDVFQRLYEATGPFHLWAHQETGNAITYDRDRAVRRWANERGIPFREPRQNGIVRGPHDRDEWSRQWEDWAEKPVTPAPDALKPVPVRPGSIPTRAELGLPPGGFDTLQTGGERAAHESLTSFLEQRGRRYTREMSSPVTAFDSCSRLSPHLAWGTITLRVVQRAVDRRRDAIRSLPDAERTDWGRALSSLESRLRWHDHFMQKLEDAPRIEHESFIPAFDELRADAHDAEREAAWAAGRTGYPLVDACMRALTATGYLNFRMRALLVSFASYDLWLDWRQFHDVLARRWVDYEPGIHFSQLQMQSGTTGINTVRVYNPTKQAREQDPDGRFIRSWVPALEDVPDAYIHTPWLMPANVQRSAGCRIGEDYPAPLVNHDAAAKRARDEIYRLRKRPDVQARARQVVADHGSRRRRNRRSSGNASGDRSAGTKKPDPPREAGSQKALDL